MNLQILEFALMSISSDLNIHSEWSKKRLLERKDMQVYRYGPWECLSYEEAVEGYFELKKFIDDFKKNKLIRTAGLSLTKQLERGREEG